MLYRNAQERPGRRLSPAARLRNRQGAARPWGQAAAKNSITRSQLEPGSPPSVGPRSGGQRTASAQQEHAGIRHQEWRPLACADSFGWSLLLTIPFLIHRPSLRGCLKAIIRDDNISSLIGGVREGEERGKTLADPSRCRSIRSRKHQGLGGPRRLSKLAGCK